jgi:hypothetical protein
MRTVLVMASMGRMIERLRQPVPSSAAVLSQRQLSLMLNLTGEAAVTWNGRSPEETPARLPLMEVGKNLATPKVDPGSSPVANQRPHISMQLPVWLTSPGLGSKPRHLKESCSNAITQA